TRLILEKDSDVPVAIKETLELYDSLQDTETKIEVLEQFMDAFVQTDQYDLAYEYLDYIYQVTQPTGQSRGFPKIFRQVLEHYVREENEEKARGTRRILSMLPVEITRPVVAEPVAQSLEEIVSDSIGEAILEESLQDALTKELEKHLVTETPESTETPVELPEVKPSAPINLEAAQPEAREASQFKSDLETALDQQKLLDAELAQEASESPLYQIMQKEVEPEEPSIPSIEQEPIEVPVEEPEVVSIEPEPKDLTSEIYAMIEQELEPVTSIEDVPAPQEQRDDFSDLLEMAESFMADVKPSIEAQPISTTDEMPALPSEGTVEQTLEETEEDDLLKAVRELTSLTELGGLQQETAPSPETPSKQPKIASEEAEGILDLPTVPVMDEQPPDSELEDQRLTEEAETSVPLEGGLDTLAQEETPVEDTDEEGGLFGALDSLLTKVDKTISKPETSSPVKDQISVEKEKDRVLDISNLIGEALDAVDDQFKKDTEESLSPISELEDDSSITEVSSQKEDFLSQFQEDPSTVSEEPVIEVKEEQTTQQPEETLGDADPFAAALGDLDDILGGEGIGHDEADRLMKERAKKKKRS
ncbi:MAG: hypothetical protein ACFFBD_15810, partial [Candidatus Hodarchaeota archaeon]